MIFEGDFTAQVASILIIAVLSILFLAIFIVFI